jgi:nitroreductase
MSINLMDIIKKRRSVRNFTEEEVSEKILQELIEAAIWAPSGSNTQSWRFIVINNRERVQLIKSFSPGLLGNPSSLIIICIDSREAFSKGGISGRDLLSSMDAAMAAQNILLVATEKGLASCVVQGFNKRAVKSLINLPEDIEPVLLISLGYSKDQVLAPPRKDLKDILFFNEWNDG